MRSIPDIRGAVRERSSLIHCITNPISINQCANAILAVGGRPIMAEHPREVSEITATAGALMLNLGNITDVRMKAMRLSARTAAEHGTPILLDAVGVACSRLRRDYACGLMEAVTPAVIKGNYSEINALYQERYRASGGAGQRKGGYRDGRDAAHPRQKRHTPALLRHRHRLYAGGADGGVSVGGERSGRRCHGLRRAGRLRPAGGDRARLWQLYGGPAGRAVHLAGRGAGTLYGFGGDRN